MAWEKYLVFCGRGDRIRVLRLWEKAAERNAGFKELLDEGRDLEKIGGKMEKIEGCENFFLDEYASKSSLDVMGEQKIWEVQILTEHF